eukprot:CAMPEP_0114634722 /NCGR_PEP_ID=MMETSP0168-20121206/16120_1 /TAXON_ID=95228 ORGANISM="Vannella sp., Strain DIVA3 517/6/12" /NCGR_SAMPLE_ID=MMETSP0168 /ASSEMBLY_ACC=CAM_ASM_000044 /LENGTH=189 /DNA_ID=CAMNT_0001846419 /DNA_START=27 /DNA_END=596 /DNA_ORIENTATION=+
MSFFDWFWDLFYAMGFFKKNATVLLLGLDNAGKTTLLHRLKTGKVHLFTPTQRAQEADIELGRVRFKTWDLGGHQQVRGLWSEHYFKADAVIFVVDANDRERFDEAQTELYNLLHDENLADTTFLVLGNKTDLPNAATRAELIRDLRLDESSMGLFDEEDGKRSMQVFMTSLLQRMGLKAAFEWLSDAT